MVAKEIIATMATRWFHPTSAIQTTRKLKSAMKILCDLKTIPIDGW